MGSVAWKALGTAATLAATVVAERGVNTLWRAATGERPPSDPSNPDVEWTDALAWALLSTGAVALAKVWATRRAAEYYRHSSGSLPKQFATKD